MMPKIIQTIIKCAKTLLNLFKLFEPSPIVFDYSSNIRLTEIKTTDFSGFRESRICYFFIKVSFRILHIHLWING